MANPKTTQNVDASKDADSEKIVELFRFLQERDISVANAASYLQLAENVPIPGQSSAASSSEFEKRRLNVSVDGIRQVFTCLMQSRKAGICPICRDLNSNLPRHLKSCAKRNCVIGAPEQSASESSSVSEVGPSSPQHSSKPTSAKPVVARGEITWNNAGRGTFFVESLKQEVLSDKTIESYVGKLDQCNSFLKESLNIATDYAPLRHIHSLKHLEAFVKHGKPAPLPSINIQLICCSWPEMTAQSQDLLGTFQVGEISFAQGSISWLAFVPADQRRCCCNKTNAARTREAEKATESGAH